MRGEASQGGPDELQGVKQPFLLRDAGWLRNGRFRKYQGVPRLPAGGSGPVFCCNPAVDQGFCV